MPRGVNMQSDSYFRARIEDRGVKGLAILTMLFVAGVIFFGLIGLAAPNPIFATSGKSETMSCTSLDCKPKFMGYLNRLTKMHQVFYLEVEMEKHYLNRVGIDKNGNVKTDADRQHDEISEPETMEDYKFKMEMMVSAEAEKSENGDRVPLKIRGHTGETKILYEIHCKKGHVKCEPLVVYAVDFLEYHGYHVDVTFVHPYHAVPYLTGNLYQRAKDAHCENPDDDNEVRTCQPHAVHAKWEMKYVNRNFTKFMFWIQYTVLAVSICVCAVYIMALTRVVEQKYWTYEQKWVMLLCIGLIGFCDPFYVIEIYTPSIFWTGLSTILRVTELCMLLLFWLSSFDIVRNDDYWNEQTRTLGCCFYAPKILIVAVIWLFTIYTYLFVRLQTKEDPTFYAGENYGHYTFAATLTLIVCLVYLLYIIVLAVMAVVKAIKHRDMKIQFQFVFILSLVALIIAVVGFIVGAFAAEIIHASEFTCMYGAVNVYVWIMAYAYYPAEGEANAETTDTGDHHEFHDEIELPQQQAIGQLGNALDDADKDSLGEVRGAMSP